MADRGGVETFLAGILIGGVIGAGVALLFAPASGKETRAYIKLKAGEAVETGKTELEKLRLLVKEEMGKLGESKEALKEAVHAGAEAYKQRRKPEEANS